MAAERDERLRSSSDSSDFSMPKRPPSPARIRSSRSSQSAGPEQKIAGRKSSSAPAAAAIAESSFEAAWSTSSKPLGEIPRKSLSSRKTEVRTAKASRCAPSPCSGAESSSRGSSTAA